MTADPAAEPTRGWRAAARGRGAAQWRAAAAGAPPAPPRVVPPADLGVLPGEAMPLGMTVSLDPDTREIASGILFGGSPPRVLRLTEAGRQALAELAAGPVASPAAAALARRLTDAGMAHPEMPVPGVATPALTVPGLTVPGLTVPGLTVPGPTVPGPTVPGVTVVVPTRDRAARLRRCLAAAAGYPLLVVDDGSRDPAAVAEAAAAADARLLVRRVNGGPAAARNTALRQVSSEFVAFLDSDCEPPPGWISALAAHFADPLVVAVAPRIVAAPDGTGKPDSTGGPLDLGDRAARVAPMTRVSYVPTAALLVRRSALGTGFDEALRYGEDVDLVWRLIEAGWRVRYEPSVSVTHAGPASLPGLLHRRYLYGTSAAPLTRRHPGRVAPLVLQPWPTVTMAALLARRPLTAGATFAVSTALLARRLRANGLPAAGITRPMAAGVWQTWLGTGRWCGQFAAPALVAVIARPGGQTPRTRWGRRLAAASLLAGPPLAQWARSRETSPLRSVATALADQAAYGAGVYAGCVRERTIAPLLPSVAWKPFAELRCQRHLAPPNPGQHHPHPARPSR
ncbi:MAG: mycofactocin biosynthesis glycosyltransferase MftF [Actinomycetota bacterium]